MHIAEGILTGQTMAATTLAGAAVVAWATLGMKKFSSSMPERKPLLGMLGAVVFLVSLLPIPAFTGTTSHPCGTPFAGILLGPAIGAGLAFLALLLQAAFFAHGGFSSLGANTLTLGLLGAGMGWLIFKLGRKLGLPLWAAAAAGGLAGDLATYAGAGGILSWHLAYFAPDPKYSFTEYLAVIYTAYLPTQSWIAIAEMIMTGLAIQAIGTQRPEVLENLGVEKKGGRGNKALVGLALAMLLPMGLMAVKPVPTVQPTAAITAEAATGFPGMDEAVNEKMAQDAGAHPRDPYLNFEAQGDLWNFVLLLGGGIAGFIVGRNWHHLFGRKP